MALTYAPYAWLSFVVIAVLVPGILGFQREAWRKALLAAWPFLLPAAACVLFLVIHLPSGGFRRDAVPYAILTAPNGTLDIFHLFRFHPYHGFLPQVEQLPRRWPSWRSHSASAEPCRCS